MLAGGKSWFETIGGWGLVVSLAGGAVVAFIISAYFYFRARRVKTLDWIPLSIASIVRTPVSTVSEGLQLTWNGVPLSTPYSISIRIQNTGNEAIQESDYATPLTVEFREATCFEARISGRSAAGVAPVGDIATGPLDKLSVPMKLMNPGDWLNLSFIADGRMAYPQVSSRISGQTRTTANVYETSVPARFGKTAALGLLGLALTVIALMLSLSRSAKHLEPLPSFVFIAGFVVLGVAVFRQMRASARRTVAYYDRSLPFPPVP